MAGSIIDKLQDFPNFFLHHLVQINHSSNIAVVIHAFLVEHHATGRCLVSTRFSLNA
jgi:hypothetical protein